MNTKDPQFLENAIRRKARSWLISGIVISIIIGTLAYFLTPWIYLGLLPMVYMLYVQVRNMGNHEKADSFKHLAKFGNPNHILRQVNTEINNMVEFNFGNLLLTRNWVIESSGFEVKVFPITDMVWTYIKQTTKRVNGVKVGTDYAAIILAKTGAIELTDNQKKVEEMLMSVKTKAPWMIVGYSDERKRMWESKREEMIAAVEKIKAEYMAEDPSFYPDFREEARTVQQ